jgi:3-phenylpropionate/trans-cinnamate dioxygenase ferredoxin reductase subunit
MSNERCVILGASHAAAQLAPSLRKSGWEGEIIVVGEEPWLPYHRPPLSKAYLADDKSVDDILIRHAPVYKKFNIEFRLGIRATEIDRDEKVLRLADGDSLGYDKLALTVGSRVRTIPISGTELEGVHYLRTIQDVEDIKRFVAPDRRAVIIGGGYIGLETASALRKLGLSVTVLEAMDRVLERVTAPELSQFYTRIHQEEGVSIVTGVSAECIEGDTSVRGVTCSNGKTYPADLVIIGVGIVPNTELAEAAGLEINNGIVVDEFARTSDPDIVAAGDCTFHYCASYQRHLRLESVQNATDQANVAAGTICGVLNEYNALPWFWSDQYDLKLQIAGLSQGFDQVIIRGDIGSSRKFAAFYLKAGKLLAVDAVNKPQEFMLGKRLILSGTEPDENMLADENVSMKEFLS